MFVCFICFTAFAPKCKVIREQDTKSHARHIPFSVPTHTQRLTKDSHNTGNFMPCSFRVVCGFFNVPQWSYINMVGICETGPTVYHPYPRRLECLTICWFNYKGSTFYSVILRPWVLVRLESNSPPPAWQPDVPPMSHRLRSWKTVHFSEQIMSKDKYPSIFLQPNWGFCVYYPPVLKIGEYSPTWHV